MVSEMAKQKVKVMALWMAWARVDGSGQKRLESVSFPRIKFPIAQEGAERKRISYFSLKKDRGSEHTIAKIFHGVNPEILRFYLV